MIYDVSKESGHAKANCFCRFLDEHSIYYFYHLRHFIPENCEDSKVLYDRISYLFSSPIITCKHLVLQERKGAKRIFLFVVNSSFGNVDFKALRDTLETTKLEFVSANILQELFYTYPGNVSIFQSIYDRSERVHVLIDDSIHEKDILAFHPMYSGDTIFLTLEETLKFMNFIGHSYDFLNIPRKERQLKRVI